MLRVCPKTGVAGWIPVADTTFTTRRLNVIPNVVLRHPVHLVSPHNQLGLAKNATKKIRRVWKPAGPPSAVMLAQKEYPVINAAQIPCAID